jgi:hypothetical protein
MGFDEVLNRASQILAGQIRGRVVVKIS